VPSFSGEMLNALIMEATVLALRKQRIFLGLKQFTSLHWYMFRSIAEEVRQALGKQSETQAILPPRLTGLDEQIQVLYKTDSFAARIASSMGKAIDGMHGLLDQNALEDTDIDTILLIGNAANTSPVYDILNSSFPDKLNRTAQNHVAMGAALHATKIAGQDQEISLDMHHLRISGVEDAQHLVQSFDKISLEDDSKQHSEFAELIGYANKHIEKQQPLPSQSFLGQDVSLNAAKKLIEEGKREEAMSVLGALSHEIEKLITKMQLDGKLAIPRTLIRQAYAMINTGNFHNAVNLSHKAYNQALDDPEIFTDMMKIHAECSLAMDRPEQYEDAINVLLCAYGHDQTDRSIHKALAERHNMHAIAMRKLNNLSKAYEIVNTALTYDPKHAGANKLLQELTDKSSLS
jgi:tetratricopeptide (TPR) repeat protein